ncbi:hypothetical protein B0H13DRAFT_1906540 [Mycena leptocephala]|nr:hypothetical protein B0H13DRAFT_1906540 [Mycena leptocephala]
MGGLVCCMSRLPGPPNSGMTTRTQTHPKDSEALPDTQGRTVQPDPLVNETADGPSRELERGAKTIEPQYLDIDGTEKAVTPHGDPGIISRSKEDTVAHSAGGLTTGELHPHGELATSAGTAIESTDRPYSQEDLDDKTKQDLIAIIRGQISRWPESTFDPSKIKKDVLKARILENGFVLSASLSLQTRTQTTTESPTASPSGTETYTERLLVKFIIGCSHCTLGGIWSVQTHSNPPQFVRARHPALEVLTLSRAFRNLYCVSLSELEGVTPYAINKFNPSPVTQTCTDWRPRLQRHQSRDALLNCLLLPIQPVLPPQPTDRCNFAWRAERVNVRGFSHRENGDRITRYFGMVDDPGNILTPFAGPGVVTECRSDTVIVVGCGRNMKSELAWDFEKLPLCLSKVERSMRSNLLHVIHVQRHDRHLDEVAERRLNPNINLIATCKLKLKCGMENIAVTGEFGNGVGYSILDAEEGGQSKDGDKKFVGFMVYANKS